MKTNNETSSAKNNEIVTQEVIDAQSQFDLAESYYKEKNYAFAIYWYCRAAEQEHAEAQYKLGYCYYWGYGMKKS